MWNFIGSKRVNALFLRAVDALMRLCRHMYFVVLGNNIIMGTRMGSEALVHSLVKFTFLTCV